MRVSEISCEVVEEGRKTRRSEKRRDGRTPNTPQLTRGSPGPSSGPQRLLYTRPGSVLLRTRGGWGHRVGLEGWGWRGMGPGTWAQGRFECGKAASKEALLQSQRPPPPPRPEPKVQVPQAQSQRLFLTGNWILYQIFIAFLYNSRWSELERPWRSTSTRLPTPLQFHKSEAQKRKSSHSQVEIV